MVERKRVLTESLIEAVNVFISGARNCSMNYKYRLKNENKIKQTVSSAAAHSKPALYFHME
ncbi:hypothetical protein EK904_004640 [Melospiza melodia maxima]|nr:hypothetical protein EK904_004640 [Melospiza melodia maxima]